MCAVCKKDLDSEYLLLLALLPIFYKALGGKYQGIGEYFNEEEFSKLKTVNCAYEQ